MMNHLNLFHAIISLEFSFFPPVLPRKPAFTNTSATFSLIKFLKCFFNNPKIYFRQLYQIPDPRPLLSLPKLQLIQNALYHPKKFYVFVREGEISCNKNKTQFFGGNISCWVCGERMEEQKERKEISVQKREETKNFRFVKCCILIKIESKHQINNWWS